MTNTQSTSTSNMPVRRITPDEGEIYRAIRLRAFAEAPTAFGTTYAEAAVRPQRWWDERAQAAASGQQTAVFISETGTAITGIAGGSREPDSVELTSMWVDPEARGQGLGRRLIEAVAEWAVEQEATQLTLWVTEGNTFAIGLYEAYGFAMTGAAQPHPSQDGLSELEMRLALPPTSA